MYIENRILYDSDGNPCTIGDKVEITCDDEKVIIDTITDITDEQDKGFEDNEIYLQNMCIPLYNIEKIYKIFHEEKEDTHNGNKLKGFVTEAEVAHKRITYVFPVVHDYSDKHHPNYYKYTCPICDMLGNKHQVLKGDKNCMLCGVNLMWEKTMNS